MRQATRQPSPTSSRRSRRPVTALSTGMSSASFCRARWLASTMFLMPCTRRSFAEYRPIYWPANTHGQLARAPHRRGQREHKYYYAHAHMTYPIHA
eukprot:scaffold188154_cov21-Prasinocladus_malaysianus.AAC.1